jgi:hypothetical protein
MPRSLGFVSLALLSTYCLTAVLASPNEEDLENRGADILLISELFNSLELLIVALSFAFWMIDGLKW